MPIQDDIRRLAAGVYDEIIQIRRDLHAHPELAFEETRTAGIVKDCLRRWGIPFEDGIAQTGVVALLEGDAEGPVIALRGDMDALPILEANEVPYRSTHAGKMHACGHDVHTSSLLGTAYILGHLREHLRGRVKLIFQPSEERLPGGASVMIREGVLQDPPVERILGQHVMPILDAGQIGVRSGMYMASADELFLRVKGRGGHGAQPHTTVDPVVIMAHIITALQSVVSRTVDPRVPSVLTFGKIQAEGATNIIPEEVYLEGTFRTFDEQWRNTAHERMRRIAEGTAQGMGGSVAFDIQRGYPVVHNDEALSAEAIADIKTFMGEENVVDLDMWMASEDFAYYTQEVPGFFYRLGTRNEARGIVHGLHTPRFDIDEEAMRHSFALMAWLAVRQLERRSLAGEDAHHTAACMSGNTGLG